MISKFGAASRSAALPLVWSLLNRKASAAG